MRIAINGTGIAGPTLAWWLRRNGHDPVLFERAAAPREGGYAIDFWGSGYEVADRMGIVPALHAAGYDMKRLRAVERHGRTVAALDLDVFRSLTDGRFTTLARSALSQAILDACAGIEMRFGTHITGIAQDPGGVDATLSDGGEERFDLVIGADGLHSAVRGAVFGPGGERQTGLLVAAFTLAGYRPRDELAYVMHTLPHRQVSRMALRDGRTLILCVFRGTSPPHHDRAAEVATVRAALDGMGWEVPAILDAMDGADDLYLDRVSQIRLPRWSEGRVALLGDAAACISLLGGEGSGLAMTEAYVLAGELGAGGDPGGALAAYEARLRPHVEAKQKAALRFAGFFAPSGWLSLYLRDLGIVLAGAPVLTKLIVGPSLSRTFVLPDYRAGPA